MGSSTSSFRRLRSAASRICRPLMDVASPGRNCGRIQLADLDQQSLLHTTNPAPSYYLAVYLSAQNTNRVIQDLLTELLSCRGVRVLTRLEPPA